MTDGPTIPPPPPGGSKSLIERVKGIILAPKTEWAVIDAEPATIGGIYTSYVCILAAIGPIALLIGQQLVGISILGISYKPSIAYTVGSAVLTYLLSLAMVYILALVIDALATSFGGAKNSVNAFKVAAYACTAAWLAGIFQVIPMLGWLGLIGLAYSAYLLYLGLPRLMRVTEDKAVGYAVVVVIIYIVLYFVAAMIVATLVASFFGLGALTGGAVVRY